MVKVPIKTEYLFILPQCLNVTADYLQYGNNDLKEHKEITDTLDKLTHEQLQREIRFSRQRLIKIDLRSLF